MPAVKAVSIKLSQGAKPGLGGVLPDAKVSAKMAATRGVPVGTHGGVTARAQRVHHPDRIRAVRRDPAQAVRRQARRVQAVHRCAHRNPVDMQGDPVTGISPDFVIVDGSEGGTGSAPQEFEDHVGMPLTEGLMLVHNALVGAGLRDRIRVGASGKVASGVDIVSRICQGADFTLSARAMMFAVGCIQAMEVQHEPLPYRCRHPGRRPHPCPGRPRQDHPGVQFPAGHGGQRRADRRVDEPRRLRRVVAGDPQPGRLRVADAGRAARGAAPVLAFGLGRGVRRRVQLSVRDFKRYMDNSAGTPSSLFVNTCLRMRFAETARASKSSSEIRSSVDLRNDQPAPGGPLHHPGRDVDVDAQPVRADAVAAGRCAHRPASGV